MPFYGNPDYMETRQMPLKHKKKVNKVDIKTQLKQYAETAHKINYTQMSKLLAGLGCIKISEEDEIEVWDYEDKFIITYNTTTDYMAVYERIAESIPD